MYAAMVVLYEPEKKYIANIKQYSHSVDLVLILDNSKESNYKYVNEICTIDNEKVVYKHFDNNIGLCSALNIGMKIAEKRGCEWALIMDDDSSLKTDIIHVYEQFISENDTSKIAVLAPVHIYDRSKKHGYEGTKVLKWAMTSGCLYNTKLFHQLGGFLEPLFVECLDLDYCYKALENGYKTIECGKAQLNHNPGITKDFSIFGFCIFKYGTASPWRYFMQARSLTWLLLRYHHYEDLIRFAWKWTKTIFLFNNKKEYIYEMRKGMYEGIRLYKDFKQSKNY